MATRTLKVIPSGYTGSSGTITSPTNGYYDSTHTDSSARFGASRSTSSNYLYYTFDTSDLPSNATITSVDASVRYKVSSTSNIKVTIQLYSNTTSKGTTVTSTSTTSTVYSISAGTWTLSELANLRLYVFEQATSSRQSKYLYFQGADVTITYTTPTKTITTNITNGSYTSHSGSTIDVEIGADQTITFVPDSGYVLSSFAVDGTLVTPTKIGDHYEYTLTDVQEDHTVSAMCSELPTYRITTSIRNAELLSPSSAIADVHEGEDYTIYFSSADNNTFESITLDGTAVTAEYDSDLQAYKYTISNVTAAHSVAIIYSVPLHYNIATSIINGQLLSPTTANMSVLPGTDNTLYFIGNTGETFNSMTVDGIAVTPTHHTASSTITYTYSTNFGTYQSYNLSNAFDGNRSTLFWSNEAQAAGKYILIEFSEPVILTGFETYSSNATDYPNPGNSLQVSSDGTTWTTVGALQASQTSTFSNLLYRDTKYVRIYGESTVNCWMVLNEVTMTYLTDYYTYEIDAIDSDKTVSIIFGEDVITHTVDISISNGTLTGTTASSMTVIDGASSTITFKGNDEMIFSSMLINGVRYEPTFVQTGTTGYNISSNYTQASGTNMLFYAIDGSSGSYFETSTTQTTGQYVMLTFDDPVTLTDVSTYCGTSGKYIQANNILQISSDGDSWTKVGTFAAQATNTFSINQPNVKYVRIYAQSSNSATLNLNEITPTYYTIVNQYEYELSNITEDLLIEISFVPYTGAYVKYLDGSWHKADTIYQKTSDGWTEITFEAFQELIDQYKLVYKSTLSTVSLLDE